MSDFKKFSDFRNYIYQISVKVTQLGFVTEEIQEPRVKPKFVKETKQEPKRRKIDNEVELKKLVFILKNDTDDLNDPEEITGRLLRMAYRWSYLEDNVSENYENMKEMLMNVYKIYDPKVIDMINDHDEEIKKEFEKFMTLYKNNQPQFKILME